MLVQKIRLIKERGNHCDALRINPTLRQVVNDYRTECRLNKVLVLKPLPLLEVDVQDDFVALEECDAILLETLEPGQHRVNLSLVFDLLSGDSYIGMLHHAVVDYRVGELQNVLAHSVLLPEDSNLRGVLLADPFKERHV